MLMPLRLPRGSGRGMLRHPSHRRQQQQELQKEQQQAQEPPQYPPFQGRGTVNHPQFWKKR
jgi:hypothetical protein